MHYSIFINLLFEWLIEYNNVLIMSIELITSLAIVVIAFVNILFTIYVFYYKDKKTDLQKEKERNLNLLTSLVLTPNLNKFFTTFENIEEKLTKLKYNTENGINEKDFLENLNDCFISLRGNFIMYFSAIDQDLYNSILNESDNLQEELNESIANNIESLTDEANFDLKISKPTNNAKSNILKHIFEFEGN